MSTTKANIEIFSAVPHHRKSSHALENEPRSLGGQGLEVEEYRGQILGACKAARLPWRKRAERGRTSSDGGERIKEAMAGTARPNMINRSRPVSHGVSGPRIWSAAT